MKQAKPKYKLSNDFIFKKVFAQDENNSELIDLLEAILDIKIEKVDIKNPELPKFIKKNGGTKTKLDQWLWLLSGREDKIEMAEKENVQVKKASKKLDKVNLTESERELYEARELGLYFQQIGLANAEERGKALGQKIGEKQGENRRNREILKKLIMKNTSDEDIMDLLEINREELEKLKNEIKNVNK